MLAGCSQLHQEEDETHHDYVGYDGEDAHAHRDRDELGPHDDLATNSLKAVGTPHIDWSN